MSKSPPFYYSCLDYDKGGIIYYNNKNMITLHKAHNHSNQVAYKKMLAEFYEMLK